MRIETREDALREIVHVLADHRQGKPVDFPQVLADLAGFLQNDKTQENQEPPITYSDVEAIMEPLSWAQRDLEDFRNFIADVEVDLLNNLPNELVENIVIRLNVLRFDIDHALDKVRILLEEE